MLPSRGNYFCCNYSYIHTVHIMHIICIHLCMKNKYSHSYGAKRSPDRSMACLNCKRPPHSDPGFRQCIVSVGQCIVSVAPDSFTCPLTQINGSEGEWICSFLWAGRPLTAVFSRVWHSRFSVFYTLVSLLLGTCAPGYCRL